MNEQILDFVIQSTNEALLLVIVVCGPPIILSMVVGLMVSLFQAVTQLQEATLTFVPKKFHLGLKPLIKGFFGFL